MFWAKDAWAGKDKRKKDTGADSAALQPPVFNIVGVAPKDES